MTIVHNPAFEDGLSSSLRAGLSAVPPDSDGALILLGDMPAVESSALARFAGGLHRPRRHLRAGASDGRRGNPILWGSRYFAEMMQLTGDAGAKQLLAQHAERVTEVTVGSDSIFADVDTPADLARLTRDARARRSR